MLKAQSVKTEEFSSVFFHILYRGDAMLTMYKNEIMIEQMETISFVNEDCVSVKMKDYQLIINGQRLCIKALSKYEMIVQGQVESLRFEYERTA